MNEIDVNRIINQPEILIFIIFLILVILISLNRKKKEYIPKKNENSKKNYDITVLTEYEEKLLALKDLYNQELIDAVLYEKKVDVISKKLSLIVGENISDVEWGDQKLIMDSLKKNIKSKVLENVVSDNDKKIEANIDNLINAVDNRINQGKNYEKD
jgi:hypothetical protein